LIEQAVQAEQISPWTAFLLLRTHQASLRKLKEHPRKAQENPKKSPGKARHRTKERKSAKKFTPAH